MDSCVICDKVIEDAVWQKNGVCSALCFVRETATFLQQVVGELRIGRSLNMAADQIEQEMKNSHLSQMVDALKKIKAEHDLAEERKQTPAQQDTLMAQFIKTRRGASHTSFSLMQLCNLVWGIEYDWHEWARVLDAMNGNEEVERIGTDNGFALYWIKGK